MAGTFSLSHRPMASHGENMLTLLISSAEEVAIVERKAAAPQDAEGRDGWLSNCTAACVWL
jgi:hypothetical protein